MKKHPFDVLENISLVGLGVGSVASLVLKEIVYTTTPLSMLVVLGLLNRRRTEQENQQRSTAAAAVVNQRLSHHVEAISHRVGTLPTPETIDQLKRAFVQRQREADHTLQSRVGDLQAEFHQRLISLEQQGLTHYQQDQRTLEEKYNQLSSSLVQMNARLTQLLNGAKEESSQRTIDSLRDELLDVQIGLQTLSNQTKPNLISLQDQIDRLDRLFGKLPPPVDISYLKQGVAELVKVIADLVPKRDWKVLSAEVQDLYRQQERLKQTLETAAIVQPLPSSLNGTSHTGRSQPVPPADRPTPHSLDWIALQRQVKDLAIRMPALEQQTIAYQSWLQQRLRFAFQQVEQRLQSASSASSQLLVDLNLPPSHSDRASQWFTDRPELLLNAMQTTQQRLILVWNWLDQALDDHLMQSFETFLAQGKHLHIGWCHEADPDSERLLSKIKRGWMLNAPKQTVQETLHRLLHLKRSYPDRFQFKVLGSEEAFIVSDRSFAVVRVTSALSPAPSLELSLQTSDPTAINKLTCYFDEPSLDPHDRTAYWNRAITRYDLGDRTGALADLIHLMSLDSEDATLYNHRGVVLYELGDPEAALMDFTQAIYLNPHQVDAYCNRGFIRSEQGNQQGAIADYTQALQQDPDHAITYFYRGMAWQKLEEHHAAAVDYSDAIDLVPSSPVVRYYRGMAWQKLGNTQGAIIDLEAAVTLFTERGSKTNAEKALKQLINLRQAAIVSTPTAPQMEVVVAPTQPAPADDADDRTEVLVTPGVANATSELETISGIEV